MIYSLTLICIALIASGYMIIDKYIMKIEEQEERFNIERQQLLDRIQAPSFAEYKQAEVKVIKAQKDDKPQPILHLE